MTRQATRYITVFLGGTHSPSLVGPVEKFARSAVGCGLGIVYGGMRCGLMGVLARSALEADGTVIGVVLKSFLSYEAPYVELSELHIVETMHERKARMAQLGDAFVVLPGGLGTLDEFFEILTWRQIGLHAKPIAVLNPDGYWDGLLAAIEGLHSRGLIPPTEAWDYVFHVESDPEILLDRLFQAWAESR
jgi:uncharacterized protein (TIGR00730 family)